MPTAANLRVLVVDDQASMRGLMRYCLQQLGVRDVEDVPSGRAALEVLMVKQFDLIISDWNMAEIDGLTLLKKIRANPLLKKMPFIMATGQSEREQVKQAIQAGVNNYLVKPFNVATMKGKIEAVIGKLT